jgi:hypothetical protein
MTGSIETEFGVRTRIAHWDIDVSVLADGPSTADVSKPARPKRGHRQSLSDLIVLTRRFLLES